MSNATIFSVPTYVPDPTSTEVVIGYQVQSCAPTNAEPLFTGVWSDITGSPFASPNNIVDIAGTYSTQYRVKPLRQVTVSAVNYTVDAPFSRPFTQDTILYDATITRQALPMFRMVFLKDGGTPQTNGTVLQENTGAGNGLWAPDGSTTKFNLQYMADDDPIKVLDNLYNLVWQDSTGAYKSAVPDVDYWVDIKNGVVQFKVAPAATDYLRFNFSRCDFNNDELLPALQAGVNGLSAYGINGYQFNQENNLLTLNQQFPSPDLIRLVCLVAVVSAREGGTEAALRSSMAWRDGGASIDPYPSRALEFFVQKMQVSAQEVRNAANAYIRGNTMPRIRGDFDMMFDMSQMAPISASMFNQFASYGYSGSSMGGFYYPWWL